MYFLGNLYNLEQYANPRKANTMSQVQPAIKKQQPLLGMVTYLSSYVKDTSEVTSGCGGLIKK